MRSLLKYFALVLALSGSFACSTACAQQSSATGGRVVLVLPFENRSGNQSLNWIGDSFPDTLNKRLSTVGFLTISRDDRAFALDHLGLPPDFKPSRATTIRIAQQLDADFVLIGSYNVTGDRISIQGQVLSVDTLRLRPPVADSAELARLFDAENAIAWKLARAMDPQIAVAEQTFLTASGTGSIPLPAFEDYIRGDNAPTSAEKLKRLQAAVTLAPGYAAALLALGKAQYANRDYDAAAATLVKVPRTDRLVLEANFYLGLSRFNAAHYAAAQQAFQFVASRLPLPEVVNNVGVALSRQGKSGVESFQRATAADPSEEDYHYNLAVALFRSGDTAGAMREIELALKLRPTDNEALELRSHLKLIAPGSKLDTNAVGGFSPLERIRRNYSEASFRQAAFQLDQLRAARLAMLSPDQRVAEYSQLGLDYLSKGLLPEAESEFQSALAANPNSALAHAGLAQVREQSGDAVHAREEAKASVILKPNVAALMVLARLDASDKQFTAADDDLSRALQLEPANAEVIALRMVVRQKEKGATP
jgi:tetratricopeptide (TPR) repeat protein